MARILAFDLSLVATGYALGVDGKIQSSGLIRGHSDGLARLVSVRDSVCGLVDREKPEFVVFEDFSFASKGNALHELIGSAYAIRIELYTEDPPIPMCFVAPQTLKKFVVGGAGPTVKKEHMLKEILRRFGHDVHDNNVADALGLAYIGMAAVGDYEPQIAPQWEVLKTVYANHPFLARYRSGPLPTPGKAAKRVSARDQPELFAPAAVQDEEGVL